jgi:hypothetical protein
MDGRKRRVQLIVVLLHGVALLIFLVATGRVGRTMVPPGCGAFCPPGTFGEVVSERAKFGQKTMSGSFGGGSFDEQSDGSTSERRAAGHSFGERTMSSSLAGGSLRDQTNAKARARWQAQHSRYGDPRTIGKRLMVGSFAGGPLTAQTTSNSLDEGKDESASERGSFAERAMSASSGGGSLVSTGGSTGGHTFFQTANEPHKFFAPDDPSNSY